MEHVLLVVQVLIAVALIGIILIQRSDTDGFGLGSGSGANLLSGRATANLLTRTTAILATLFILNSLALSILAARHGHRSIVEQIQQEEGSAPVPAPVGNLRQDAEPAARKASAKKNEDVPAITEKNAPAVPTAE
jgi:preprotein translocase subunit SecG